MKYDWAWQPPRAVDPGRVIFSKPKEPKKHRPPPGEVHWRESLGRQLDRIMEDNP